MTTTTPPRLTAELFTIPVDDAYLVYAPLRQAAFLTGAGVVNEIAALSEGAADSCRPGGEELVEFLRHLEILDGGEEIPPITSYAGDPKPVSLTLFLTTACNLRCTYCYASAGETPTRAMLPEVARKGIDFVIRNAVARGETGIEIAYHGGGEPSVNWRTLTESLAYAREQGKAHGLTVHAAMASNGVMPDEKIDWIVANLDGVSLSFDGLPEVNDANRIDLLGRGSSSRIIHTIRRFDAAGFPYGLRLTVTLEHIPRMEESVRFVCANFRPKRIQVEPAYQLGRWRDAPSAETAGFIAGFRAAQTAARAFGQEINFSAARVGALSNHFCGATQDSFALTAEGKVSACYETFIEENEWSPVFFYGESDESDGYRFNLPVLEQLRHQSVEHRDFCRGCFAKWTCGGDCYHKSLSVNGAGEFKGSDRCHIIRELTRDQILTKIAQAGGVFWHEARQAPAAAQGKELLL
jgi:uncharacterized protein